MGIFYKELSSLAWYCGAWSIESKQKDVPNGASFLCGSVFYFFLGTMPVSLKIVSLFVISRITRQGFPAAKQFAGISFVTTEPAPITEPSPIVTPPQIVTFAAIQQLSPMVMGFVYSRLVTVPVFSLKKALRS